MGIYGTSPSAPLFEDSIQWNSYQKSVGSYLFMTQNITIDNGEIDSGGIYVQTPTGWQIMIDELGSVIDEVGQRAVLPGGEALTITISTFP